MQMASAAQVWMYRQPQEDWENFLSGVNIFLNQAEADTRNRGVQAMLCPCIDCLNQKKFSQREIIFHHLVTRAFTKNYTCWNKHGVEGLNELEAGCLNEAEVRHPATDHDEDLDDSGVFEENEQLFSPNVMRPEDITNDLRPLVDDLKKLLKPGLLEVWDEYKRGEFTMHAMLFTTINNNSAHRNLSVKDRYDEPERGGVNGSR
jgi:hypothetical protein